MQFSGYPKTFRYQVVKKALIEFDRRENRETGLAEANNQKKRKHRWYEKDGEFDSIIFVQPTVGGEMKRKVENIAKRLKLNFKVVEKSGQSVKDILQRSDPFGRKLCGRNGCSLCGRAIDVDCREAGVVYDIKCRACQTNINVSKKEYRGQTGRIVGARIDKHVKDMEDKKIDTPLGKHSVEVHDGDNFELDVSIRAKCFGKPSKRLITEAVMIEEMNEDVTMNSKSEWKYIDLRRVNVT